MSEEQLNASLDAGGANLAEEGAQDVELTNEELSGVAGGSAGLLAGRRELGGAGGSAGWFV